MKKKWLTTSSLVAVSALSILGTMAYFQTEDEAVNIMKNGNIKIVQSEYQRPNGTTDSNILETFTQNKPLYPVYGNDNKEEQTWELKDGSTGSSELLTKLNNVQDKFVFVKNTGKNPVYYRTIIAVEAPLDESGEVIDKINLNKNENKEIFVWSDPIQTEIGGVSYLIYEAVYQKVLQPNKVSEPSLLQVYLDKDTTNEQAEAFGDSFEILVVTQATQVEGTEYTKAVDALNGVFYPITSSNHPWTDGVEIPTTVNTVDELAKALAAGEDVVLTGSIIASGEETINIPSDTTATINLNGYTIKNEVSGKPAITNYGDLTITGGTIVNENTEMQGASAIRNYGTLELNDMNVGSDLNRGMAVENIGGDVTINGGVFETIDRSLNKGFAYVFTSDGGTMKINDATVSGEVQGVFAATNGAVIDVDGGSYTMEPNGNIYYMVYCINNARVNLIRGTYTWHNRASVTEGAVFGDENVTISSDCVLNNWR